MVTTFDSKNEQDFRDWLKLQIKENGMRRYTDNAIIAYCYALRTLSPTLKPPIEGTVFRYKSPMDVDMIYEQIYSAENFDEVNASSGNNTFSVALKLYHAFIHGGKTSTAPEIYAEFYKKEGADEELVSSDNGALFHYEEIPMTPVQKIFYGVPGTGKSYNVQKLMEKEYPDRAERDEHCRRLIFHPTYSYEDFVGSIKPLISLDKPLDYIYSAGPFTLLLKSAFMNPAEKYYLIIEEVNRGNAPAIFGDLFQLLDRLPSGKSSYAVVNSDITAYFSRDPGLRMLFNEGKVWLPANFNILCTMNTADENIFVLDNAFKRRFTLEYVRICFDNMPAEWIKPCTTFMGDKPLLEVFAGSIMEEYVKFLYSQNKLERNWPTFALIVNHIIDDINLKRKKENDLNAILIPENKKLGPFFISKEDLTERETFINKVIFYLKQDVFCSSAHYMTISFEEIYDKYARQHADVFELLV